MTSDTVSLHAGLRHLTHHYVSLALRCDYLSSGAGHQQSRRAVKERHAAALRKRLRPAGVDAGRDDSGDELEAGAESLGPHDCERRYLMEVASKPRLTSREEYGLVVRMRRGERAAHDALIESNLGLVVMVARRYQRHGIPLTDLIAEGNFGLMRAAGRFDPEIGCRFATYAKWWVRQSIQLALPKLANVVRMPLPRRETSEATPSAHGTQETHEPHEPHETQETQETHGAHEPQAVDAAVPTPPSDAAAEPGTASGGAGWLVTSDPEVLDAIPIDPEHEPPGAMMAAQRLRLLHQALDALGERDRLVIAGRYALSGAEVCTLQDLATRFGVSIERVRQIENAAVKKLAKWLQNAGAGAAALL